jgi:hypothetical protein
LTYDELFSGNRRNNQQDFSLLNDESHYFKTNWAHAPCHRFDASGTYMVTSSTLYKNHFFKKPQELSLLQTLLFELANRYEWRLEAWAIFSNHYPSLQIRRMIS